MAAAVARAIRKCLPTSRLLSAPASGSSITQRRFSANGSDDSYSCSNFGDPLAAKMGPLFCCTDYEHWIILMDRPGGEDTTGSQMVRCYLQTLAKVVASEDDAFSRIYKVSCKEYFGFGCEIDEETSNKLKGLPGVLMVLPDPEYNYCRGMDGQFIPKSILDDKLSHITEKLNLLSSHLDQLEQLTPPLK